MSDEMGTFRTDLEVVHPARSERRASLSNVLVGTGAELSWIPAATLDALGIERKKIPAFSPSGWHGAAPSRRLRRDLRGWN